MTFAFDITETFLDLYVTVYKLFLFVCIDILYIPVNKFSAMSLCFPVLLETNFFI